ADPGRVHLFPNGVDPNLFQPAPPEAAVRARLGLDDGPVLGFVGGLRPWHGVDLLPELVEGVAQRYRNLHLVIVGDGPLRPPLQLRPPRGTRARSGVDAYKGKIDSQAGACDGMMPNLIAYIVNVFPKLSETLIAGESAELGRYGIELRVLSLRQPKEARRHDF